jgi:dTDP-4-amino-4,6-dideoxygalactose transaminase
MIGKLALAVFGAKPRIGEPLPVGQFYWPDWERYEQAARDIFSRRFYTSQRFAGPLVVKFQRPLQEFLQVKHVIAVRNATNGLMIVAHTLGLRGKVIVPAWTCIATVQSLAWSKCQPVFCDIDVESQQMSCGSVKRLLEAGGIEGILGVHLWGNAAPVRELELLAREYGVSLYYDAAHAFGCKVRDRAIGTFGGAEVFSFHAANILSTAEGACIVTNDDLLASKFIAMRGDEVSGGDVVMQSATARMSEMQAAVGLMMLDDFEQIRRINREQHDRYRKRLSSIPGIRMLEQAHAVKSNFQYVVGVVDQAVYGLSRDVLVAVLRAENVAAERRFYPASHQVHPFSEISVDDGQLKATELAAQSTFQLPIGARATTGQIEQICDIIYEVHIQPESVKSALASLVAAQKAAPSR